MLNGEVSIVKAVFDYFGDNPNGLSRVTEFKALNDADRDDLRTELIAEGYSISPLS